ncbi:nitric oxide synthase [Paenibacillus psychroresistens]|uniref:Nitric oxide synthase oxygenase n=1 Tax=Paenibacillus psychroresistens TaxID=1778678 RepID=A0A6B8RUG6_9BACL|nr:nitric oxide synthase oxygenase [Paenibacillus psychroresistens]QGQ99597.1 nitric oxide synthase [Paenibacillus psychroresistens]
MIGNQWVLEEAEKFIRISYGELGKSYIDVENRLQEIRQAVAEKGTYEHTYEELKHGAKMAWRNSNKCIGRLFWDMLEVYDMRSLDEEERIAEALFSHIELATNGGKIRSSVTVFKPAIDAVDQVMIWNDQLLSYAGYETEEGIMGDPLRVALTKKCLELGWSGKNTRFDILPLVIQIGDKAPQLFEIPPHIVKEVNIVHPDIPAFAELDLKWYGVPIVSNMLLEIGGIKYTAAPFNGWYVGTEIGARNLSDTGRYNMLPEVAAVMGLDTRKAASLWQDKALVELNIAVLHSYKDQGVMIIDHHTAAEQFMRFEKNEQNSNRELTGRWSWLISPLSPATTPIFHRSYDDTILSPNFYYQ